MARPRRNVVATTIALALGVSSAAAGGTVETVLRSALAAACSDETAGIKRMAREIDEDAAGLHHQPIRDGKNIIGWSRSFLLRRLGIVEIARLAPGGALANVQINLQISDGRRVVPVYSLLAGGDCAIVEARRLYYRPNGQVDRLELLDSEFVATSAATELNPPFPLLEEIDHSRSGVRVAVIDSGVNYRLPHIAGALARDADNKPLGYDYWDLDDFPFDSDARGSPFYPLRRGTRIAGVLTLESPGAFLVPYRFPFPDVRRMVDVVVDADRVGVRVMLVSFASRGRGDWHPFRRQAAGYENMLLVISAGIGGRNLDRDPLFPASLALSNALIVTGVNKADGVLLGANWGVDTVDVAVRAEDIGTLGFDGNARTISGVDVGAARIAALAARLLEINPGWNAERVRAEIIGRAKRSTSATRRTRHGIVEIATPPADPS